MVVLGLNHGAMRVMKETEKRERERERQEMARERKPKERSRLPTTDAVSLFQFPCDGSVTRLRGNGRGAYVEQNRDRKRRRLVDTGNATGET